MSSRGHAARGVASLTNPPQRGAAPDGVAADPGRAGGRGRSDSPPPDGPKSATRLDRTRSKPPESPAPRVRAGACAGAGRRGSSPPPRPRRPASERARAAGRTEPWGRPRPLMRPAYPDDRRWCPTHGSGRGLARPLGASPRHLRAGWRATFPCSRPAALVPARAVGPPAAMASEPAMDQVARADVGEGGGRLTRPSRIRHGRDPIGPRARDAMPTRDGPPATPASASRLGPPSGRTARSPPSAHARQPAAGANQDQGDRGRRS